MGIDRSSSHKRYHTGAKRIPIHNKRKCHRGRQPSMTKIGEKQISPIRGLGGNIKPRALRLDSGSFSWGEEGVSRKCRIMNVVYHPSSNELVRTNTLTKGAIIEIDAAPFRQWYEQHYNEELPTTEHAEPVVVEANQSKGVLKMKETRRETHSVDTGIMGQFRNNRLLACVSSRPGQQGVANGYILTGAELDFYMKKIAK